MTNILLISLTNDSEIIETSYLINSLLRKNPHSDISLLVLDEFKSIAQMLNGVNQIFTINKHEIEGMYQSPLFSQAFAVNSFTQSLAPCLDTNWDMIINFSNTKLTKYLSSYIPAKKVIGTALSQSLETIWANDWEAYGSFTPDQSVGHLFTKHFMSGIGFSKEGQRLKINKEYAQVSIQNFMRIRRSKGPTTCYIVGISLMADKDGNRLDLNSIGQIIENLEASTHYKPVLIMGNNPIDRELCNKLNANFNNQLISITADSEAITSVLSNLDVLISKNNIHSVIAEALNIRLVEMNLENQHPSIIMPENYYILQNHDHFHDEVCYILNNCFENELPVESISQHSKIYQSIHDDYSTYYTQISGPIDIQSELKYHTSRVYQFELMGEKLNDELLTHLSKNTDNAELLAFIDKNKNDLTNCVKYLLATLRSLKGMKQSNENKKNFVQYLDLLLEYAKADSLISCPVSLFAGKIENSNFTSLEQNIKDIELALFTLKNNLQKLTNIFETLMNIDRVGTLREKVQNQ